MLSRFFLPSRSAVASGLRFLVAAGLLLLGQIAGAAPAQRVTLLPSPLEPAAQWKAIATESGLRTWAGAEAAIDLRRGGTLRLDLTEGAPPTAHEIVAFEPGRLLVVAPALEGPAAFDPARPSWSLLEPAGGREPGLLVTSRGSSPTPEAGAVPDLAAAFGRAADHAAALAALAAPDPGRHLVHTRDLAAPLADAWAMVTTPAGLEAWCVRVAEVDLRTGGSLRSRHDEGALGEPGTITQEILALERPRLLVTRAVPTPDIPATRLGATTWSVLRLEPIDDATTRLTLTGLGWPADDPEADQLFRFFDAANAMLLDRLAAFLRERADRAEESERLRALFARLASGGEWIHEGPTPDGGVFRVRSLYRLGPGGRSVVARGWLGNADGLMEHGAFQAWVEPIAGAWRFQNLDENGGVARGTIHSPAPETIEYDWVQTLPQGVRGHFRVKLLFAGEDAYRFTIAMLPAGGAAPVPMVDIEVRRITAPEALPAWVPRGD